MVSIDLTKRETIAAPLEVQPTGRYDGYDGSWSSFAISIGTPPQSFRVLPATIDPHVTVPIPGGCAGGVASVSNCGDLRGVEYYNGVASRGFDDSISSTWTPMNIYDIFTGQSIYDDKGMFGNDTVTISGQDRSTGSTIKSQVVAELTSIDYWLGSIGLGNALTNYSLNNFVAPSLLYNLKGQGIIPSISYGYTAGQYYNNRLGSLILGGWDANKMSSNNMTTKIQGTNTTQQYLNINLQSVLAQHIVGGVSASLLSEQVVASIDSSVNQLFLPTSACDILAQAFGLTYDDEKEWYLINDTMHDTLRAKNASLTFRLGGDSGTTDIVMAYNSLDLQIGIPWYNSSINYFPMKRAVNASQIVLGRAFLQEAYVVVDWERNSMTVGQVMNTTSSSIQAITTQSAAPASGTTSPAVSGQSSAGGGGGIGTGAIAGIVVAVLLLAAIGGLFFWQRRRPKHKRWSNFSFRKSDPPPAYDNGAEYYGGDKPEQSVSTSKGPHEQISELFDSSKPRAELTSDIVRRFEEMVEQRELMSTPVAELVGDTAGSELDVTSNTGRESLVSDGITSRTSMASPPRLSVLGPERTKSPLGSPPLFEME